MLLLAADEDFNHDIIRGLRRREPSINIITVQEAGITAFSDPEVLEWTASQGRVLFTHDVSTMSAHAYERVARHLPMPGVFEIRQQMPIGLVIEEILLIAMCSEPGEWEGQVRHLPLQ
jgi:hypothetical protein